MSTSTTAATPTAVPHAALTLLILRLNGLIDRGCSPPLAEQSGTAVLPFPAVVPRPRLQPLALGGRLGEERGQPNRLGTSRITGRAALRGGQQLRLTDDRSASITGTPARGAISKVST